MANGKIWFNELYMRTSCILTESNVQTITICLFFIDPWAVKSWIKEGSEEKREEGREDWRELLRGQVRKERRDWGREEWERKGERTGVMQGQRKGEQMERRRDVNYNSKSNFNYTQMYNEIFLVYVVAWPVNSIRTQILWPCLR
jgi:hypothetical protein